MSAATSYAHNELANVSSACVSMTRAANRRSPASSGSLAELKLSLSKRPLTSAAPPISARSSPNAGRELRCGHAGDNRSETQARRLSGKDRPGMCRSLRHRRPCRARNRTWRQAIEGSSLTPPWPIALWKTDPKIAEAIRRYKENSGKQEDPDDFFLVSYAGPDACSPKREEAGRTLR